MTDNRLMKLLKEFDKPKPKPKPLQVKFSLDPEDANEFYDLADDLGLTYKDTFRLMIRHTQTVIGDLD